MKKETLLSLLHSKMNLNTIVSTIWKPIIFGCAFWNILLCGIGTTLIIAMTIIIMTIIICSDNNRIPYFREPKTHFFPSYIITSVHGVIYMMAGYNQPSVSLLVNSQFGCSFVVLLLFFLFVCVRLFYYCAHRKS